MIALAHFLRTGEFGALKIGDSRARIAELLGDPPLWGAQPKKENAEIWKYGAFEFYFQNHALGMIFTDETKAYSLGKNALQIDDFEAGMTLDAAPQFAAPRHPLSRRFLAVV